MAAGTVTIDAELDTSRLRRGLTGTQRMIRKWGRRVSQVFIGVGLVILSRKFFAMTTAVKQNYKDQMAAEARLGAVVRSTGTAAGWTMDKMKELAASLQFVTGTGDEVILNMLAVLATFKNIRGDTFSRAALAIEDMSEVLGTDLKGAAIQVGKALQDPIKGVIALRRVGVQLTNAQVKSIEVAMAANDIYTAQSIILKELESEFGGAASAVSNATRKWEQLGNRALDVSERLGKVLGPTLFWLSSVLDQMIAGLETGAGKMEEWSGTIFAVGNALKWLADQVLQGFVGSVGAVAGIAAQIWENMVEGFSLGFAYITYKTSVFVNTVIHLFTKVLMDQVVWFAVNFQSAMSQMAANLANVFQNAKTNLNSFFVWLAVKLRGGTTNWEWKGLADGLEISLTKLPGIAKRKIGPVETVLKNNLGVAMANLLDNNTLMGAGLEGYMGAIAAFTTKPPEAPDAPDVKQADVDPPDRKKKSKATSKGNLEDVGTTFKRIQKAAASRDPQVTMVKLLTSIDTTLKTQKDTQKDLRLKTSTEPNIGGTIMQAPSTGGLASVSGGTLTSPTLESALWRNTEAIDLNTNELANKKGFGLA